jgi:hypothetical protein
MSPTRTAQAVPSPLAQASPEVVELARHEVRRMLEASPSFVAMTPEQRREIARNTVAVVAAMAEPAGVRPASAEALDRPERLRVSTATDPNQPPQFRAQGAREGAAVAGALLEQVNFPSFVASLVKGVFHAIVQSSIEQMEAYGRLVADVAKSLNQFRDENVSANQGRDHLVEQFPDLFEINMDTGEDFFGESGGGPRVQLRSGVDEQTAVDRVGSLPVQGGPVRDVSPETIEERLVPAARTQLATSRQQLLATMVMMGINRIVVTDGRISAKVLYDFRAKDNMRYRQSATQFDYDDTRTNRVSEGDYESDYQGGSRSSSRGKDGEYDEQRQSGSYYSKGTYKTVEQPAITLMKATQTEGGASLETKASLAGVVDINFKSDYFPLEKLADSFQIAQIQQAAAPGAGAARPAAAGAPAGGAITSPTPTGQPAPAPAQTPAPAATPSGG